ncbi:MAG: hypothetical protein V1736_10400 [Pseudomonadota bacterium]
MKKPLGILLVATFLCLSSVPDCLARPFLFHATGKALARKIAAKGFSIRKMQGRSRFGRGLYLAHSPKTAMMERKGANSLLRVRSKKAMTRSSLNLTHPTPKGIRTLVGVRDLRGATKKGIIGPKLGHRLGRYAGKTGKPIRYRSAKNSKGANLFIPRRLYKKHPFTSQTIQQKINGRYR